MFIARRLRLLRHSATLPIRQRRRNVPPPSLFLRTRAFYSAVPRFVVRAVYFSFAGVVVYVGVCAYSAYQWKSTSIPSYTFSPTNLAVEFCRKVTEWVNATKDGIKSVSDQVSTHVSTGLGVTKDGIKSVPDHVSTHVSTGLDVAKSVSGHISTHVSTGLGVAKDGIKSVPDHVSTGLEAAKDGIKFVSNHVSAHAPTVKLPPIKTPQFLKDIFTPRK